MRAARSADVEGGAAALGPRLRALRHERGLTLDALAAAAHLDKGYLSRLERGLKAPSIATLLRLSEALGAPVAVLLGERLDGDAVRVTRAGSRLAPVAPGGGAGHAFEALSRDGAALEAFVIRPGPDFEGGDYEPARHAGEELIFVLSGTIEMRFADRGFVLEAGDCAQFDGHLTHRLRRLGPAPAAALVAVAKAPRPPAPRRGAAPCGNGTG